ncbi:MAG TPA: cytochrome c oxidase subunit II [Cyclobacteriaceae bacterium]|nr:cytochrome c oxidase subunit II [Cyclobacteriaceae bacterium]
MMSLIIGVGVVLVLAILYMIFRIGNLIGVAKGKPPLDGVDEDTNNLNGWLMLAFLVFSLVGFFWYSFAHIKDFELPVASKHGVVTDDLFWLTMWVVVISFTIIFIGLFWFTFAYRYDKNRRAEFISDNHKLELVWTIVPAVVLALLIFGGLEAWSDITGKASDDAEVIEVIGQQFAWTIRYPGVKDNQLGRQNYKLIDNQGNEFGLDLTDKNSFDDFKALELHIPVGHEVALKIRAKDVLHSVFLPHFRVKMDAVPGIQTNFKFTATHTTEQMREQTGNPNFNYEMACTEICGQGHFSMRLLVVVETKAQYDAWKAAQTPWLKQNPEYLNRVPAELREVAQIKAGFPMEASTSTVADKAPVSTESKSTLN